MSIPFFDFRNKPKAVEKKQGNKIIVMANQKGGVGKSTNGIMFANYLTDMGVQIAMIDADPQLSIMTKHEEDVRKNPDMPVLYPVKAFKDLDDEPKTLELVKKMRSKENDFIIDTPGNLSLQGMVPLILEADVIISPLQYEETCMESLNAFINLVVDVCNSVGRETLTPMIFIPNMHNKNWGTKEEIENQKLMEENLRIIGKVSPKVPSSPEIRRYSSLYTTPKQRELTGDCYGFLLENIYGNIIRKR